MARLRQATVAASLPRWARPGEGRWDDWMTQQEMAAELEVRGELARVTLLYRLTAGLDLLRAAGGPGWEAAGLQPAYPALPHEITEDLRSTGAPPRWLRERAREVASHV